MNVKDTWSNSDFEEMGWHDSHIYAISFPDENFEFVLDIDYIFEWVLNDKTNRYGFWISPCTLAFDNVFNLAISLNFENTIDLDIQDIYRSNSRLSPNGKITLWDFEILTDKGYIKFESSGYRQIVKRQPIFNESQVLGRKI